MNWSSSSVRASFSAAEDDQPQDRQFDPGQIRRLFWRPWSWLRRHGRGRPGASPVVVFGLTGGRRVRPAIVATGGDESHQEHEDQRESSHTYPSSVCSARGALPRGLVLASRTSRSCGYLDEKREAEGFPVIGQPGCHPQVVLFEVNTAEPEKRRLEQTALSGSVDPCVPFPIESSRSMAAARRNSSYAWPQTQPGRRQRMDGQRQGRSVIGPGP